jgi:hypothetical protein
MVTFAHKGTNLICLEIQPVKIYIELRQIENFRYSRSYTEIEKNPEKNDSIKSDFDIGTKNFDLINFDFDFRKCLQPRVCNHGASHEVLTIIIWLSVVLPHKTRL